MKTLLFLLPLALFADLYECENSFIITQDNAIIEVRADGETVHKMREVEHKGYCYDYHDAGQELYVCIEQNGSNFNFITSHDNWTEKCVRVDE